MVINIGKRPSKETTNLINECIKNLGSDLSTRSDFIACTLATFISKHIPISTGEASLVDYYQNNCKFLVDSCISGLNELIPFNYELANTLTYKLYCIRYSAAYNKNLNSLPGDFISNYVGVITLSEKEEHMLNEFIKKNMHNLYNTFSYIYTEENV